MRLGVVYPWDWELSIHGIENIGTMFDLAKFLVLSFLLMPPTLWDLVFLRRHPLKRWLVLIWNIFHFLSGKFQNLFCGI